MKKLLFIILILFAGNAMASSLPNCPSDQLKRYHNCFGTITTDDGSIYVGEWKDNNMHGQGTYTTNEYKYLGEYKEGKKHGQGTFTTSTGNKYVGEYKEGKMHGQGTATFPGGSKYIGEFREGKMHGQGIASSNKYKYVGEHKDNKKHGQGTFTFADGTNESGYFMNDEYVPTICENMGLKKGSDPFGQCVVELIKQIRDDD